MKIDLSVGQRLAIGFALMLVLWACVFAAVSRSNHASERAQAAFAQDIAPLRDKAMHLERSVFQLGIDTRSYLISPEDTTLDAYRGTVADVRAATRDLLDQPKDERSASLYRGVLPCTDCGRLACADGARERVRFRRGFSRASPARRSARHRASTAAPAFCRRPWLPL